MKIARRAPGLVHVAGHVPEVARILVPGHIHGQGADLDQEVHGDHARAQGQGVGQDPGTQDLEVVQSQGQGPSPSLVQDPDPSPVMQKDQDPGHEIEIETEIAAPGLDLVRHPRKWKTSPS